MRRPLLTRFFALALLGSAPALAQSPDGGSPAEATAVAPADPALDRALRLLRDKGVISAAEYEAVAASETPPPPPPAPPAAVPQPAAAPAPASALMAMLSKFSATLYGFVEFDAVGDTTQSFGEQAANAAIARPGTYAGTHGRMTFSVRNSRLGFKLAAPEFHGLKVSGVLEMDFLGNQPPGASEAAVFANPAFRLRHYLVKIENPYVDIIIGQWWQVFGWQSFFAPNSVEIQGVPGQIYGRAPQLRLSHLFKTEAVSVEIAAAASRPPQRNAWTPDGQGGVKLSINPWKGVHTLGATVTAADPASLGISGLVRRFALPEFTASPTRDVTATGWGYSIDAFIPIIPAALDKKANALSLTASYMRGAGIADQFSGLNGGISFPALPNPDGLTPAPTYTPDVDNGLVVYDADGNLHPILWQSFKVGLQYYLPPSGTVWISANYAQMNSNNIAAYGKPSAVFTQSRWVNGNLFWDITPAVRVGLQYEWFNQTYADGTEANNHRIQAAGFLLF